LSPERAGSEKLPELFWWVMILVKQKLPRLTGCVFTIN